MASLTKLVSSLPRDSSQTFLLGKLVGHRSQSPVRKQNYDSSHDFLRTLFSADVALKLQCFTRLRPFKDSLLKIHRSKSIELKGDLTWFQDSLVNNLVFNDIMASYYYAVYADILGAALLLDSCKGPRAPAWQRFYFYSFLSLIIKIARDTRPRILDSWDKILEAM